MMRPSALALVLCAGIACVSSAQPVRGPSTLQNPYMIPSDPASGVAFLSIASNGNGTLTPDETFTNLRTGNDGYRFVGIPDGLGVFQTEEDAAAGVFRVTCNHELGATSGVVRAHGNKGSFVSEWIVRQTDFSVVGGKDLFDSVYLWNSGTASYSLFNTANPMSAGFARFCSADMAATSAYRFGAFGTDAHLHLTGEENGAEGRPVAVIATGPEAGTVWELPRLGRYSWENSVTNPHAQLKTVHIGSEDGTPGNLYIYVGTKQDTGNTIERAGLTNGNLYALKIEGTTVAGGQHVEDRTYVLGNSVDGVSYSKPFSLVNLGDVSSWSGARLQTEGEAVGQMNFLRPEDVTWDLKNDNRAYFVTTDSFSGNSRAWAVEFVDIENPELGGTVRMLFDGSVPSSLAGGLHSATGLTDVRMMDNLAVSHNNQLIIQEDVGNNARLGRLWLYDITADSVTEIGISDPSLFVTGASAFLTQDEETSGVVDASQIIAPGWWLLDMQAHYASTTELAEGGQLMALYIPETNPCPADFDGDNFVTGADYDRFVRAFEAGYISADFDHDGFVTGVDFDAYVQAFEGGCSK